MAYTGVTNTVFIRVCEQWNSSTGPLDCAWIEVSRTVLDTTEWDLTQLNQLFMAIILLCTTIFIIKIIKKAIEQ